MPRLLADSIEASGSNCSEVGAIYETIWTVLVWTQDIGFNLVAKAH